MIHAIKKLINFFLEVKNNFAVYRKARKIEKKVSITPLTRNDRSGCFKKWSKLGNGSNCRYLKLYSAVYGIQSENFVPENIYYNKIEPVLNNRIYSQSYADKNFYDLYFKGEDILFPQTILRKIDKVYYDSGYEPITGGIPIEKFLDGWQKVLIKPGSETGGGVGVKFFQRNASNELVNEKNEELTFEYLNRFYPNNLIVQEYIAQHPFFSRFNETSVNTVRLLTYRSVTTNQVIPLSAVLRVGLKGAVVDNQASGGVSAGIGQNGFLNNFAVSKYGEKFYKINEVNLSEKLMVPKLEQMKETACRLASKMFYTRLLGFDFAVDSEGNVILIEINCRNIEINFLQMNNGPLFNTYTAEVIEYCSKNPKAISLDFYVKSN